MKFSPIDPQSRAFALAGSVVITLFTVVSMALIGHPPELAGAVYAKAATSTPALQVATAVTHR